MKYVGLDEYGSKWVRPKPKIFLTSKILVPEKLFSPKDNFGLNYILYPNFLRAEKLIQKPKIYFAPKFCQTQKIFPTKQFLGPKFF